MEMWHLRTWFRGELGSVRFEVGLYLKGLFQHKLFCYSSKENTNCAPTPLFQNLAFARVSDAFT